MQFLHGLVALTNENFYLKWIKLVLNVVLRLQAFCSSQKALILCLALAFIALAVPQARSLNKVSQSSKTIEDVTSQLSPQSNPRTVSNEGLRPIPANRYEQAKRSTDGQRNPFVINYLDQTGGNAQPNNQSIVSGLSSVRLTGIVQEGASLKALVEDGSRHGALSLGDHLALGTLDGSGFRVVAISFDQGSISISNGRAEYQLFVPQ